MSKHDDYYTKFAIYGNNDSLETLKKKDFVQLLWAVLEAQHLCFSQVK